MKDHLLKNYFANKYNNEIKIEEYIDTKYVDIGDGYFVSTPNIELCIIDKNDNQMVTSNLTKIDIEEALADYISSLGYVFESFKYVGGVRHAGYFIEEDTPFFEGIQIFAKEKSLEKKRVL